MDEDAFLLARQRQREIAFPQLGIMQPLAGLAEALPGAEVFRRQAQLGQDI